MTNELRINELQDKIKQYQNSLGKFDVVDLKFTNKWGQEYSIRTYLKDGKRYLSTSAATSCICEPGLQLNFQKTSWLDNQRRTWKGCVIGSAVHFMAENPKITIDDALFESLRKNPYFQEIDDWYNKTVPLILESIGKAYLGYRDLWSKSKFISLGKEITFFNDELMIAGTIDDLVYSRVTNKFGILDLKTGNTTNGVSIESKMSCYKFLAESNLIDIIELSSPLFFTIFDLPKDPEDKNGYFFTYNHYDLNLDSFLGALAIFKVAHWKQLKTFWPGWDERIKNIFNLNHLDFCDPDDDVRNENIAMSLTENQ